MTETMLSLSDLGVTEPAPSVDPSSAVPSAKNTESSSGASGAGASTVARSADAKAIDDQVKDAVRRNVTNHELTCIVVDLVSPGQAIERLGGVGLDKLTPTQHLIVACLAITGTVLVTNPDLAKKLKGSMTKSIEARDVDDQRKKTMKTAAKQVVHDGPEPARHERTEAIDETGQPIMSFQDLTGEVLN